MQLLQSEADIEVVGEADDGVHAHDLALRVNPDIVLMDIRMPLKDGIQATAEICGDADLASTRVLVLTTFEEDEYVVAALRAGASGFIGKGAEPEEITRALRAVHGGDALLSPIATRSLISRYLRVDHEMGGPSHAVVNDAALTPRENEILVLVARGLSNDDIARELYISAHTAKTHVKRIMAKLDAHDRAQCVIYAYETGLLTPVGER